MKVSCIIQARVGSTRLPKKVLLNIVGKPVLYHVIDRVLKSNEIDNVIVATTTNPSDKEIVRLVKNYNSKKVSVFCGSENDVLDRYYKAAKNSNSDIIVRVTSDCPLIDWRIIDLVVLEFKKGNYDYVSNILTKRTFPRGLDVECFSFSVLKHLWKICQKNREREHVTTYIRENKEKFRTKNIEQKEDLSYLRWTLDEPDDLKLIEKVYSALYNNNRYFDTEDIMRLFKEKPKLKEINAHVEQKKNIKNEVN